MSEQTPAGWYPAPGYPPGTNRYWDGAQWVGEPQAAAAQGEMFAPGGFSGGASNQPSRLGEPISRIAARVIDGIIWGIIGFIISLPVAVSTFTEAIDAANDGRDLDVTPNPVLVIVLGTISIAVITGYEVFMNSRMGGTFGKKALSLTVTREDGSALEPKDALMRMVPYIVIQGIAVILQVILNPQDTIEAQLASIPFYIVALIGLAMLFSDDRHQTPWDKVGKTLVMQK